MRVKRTPDPSSRAVSETAGVAVLVGMTVLVTVFLGLGTLIIAEDDESQSADMGFTHLTDELVIVYEDERERPAGDLYVHGPENNVTWAELDEDRGPDDMVEQDSVVRAGQDSEYGHAVREDDAFDIVFFEDGQRFVLASWNKDPEDETPPGEDPGGPGDPIDPDDPDGPDGPDGPQGP